MRSPSLAPPTTLPTDAHPTRVNPDPQGHDPERPADPIGEVTRLLQAIRAGAERPQDVVGRLIPLMYEELHALASRQRGGQPQGWTLQPTALVNELYLKLASSEQQFADRQHFVAVAAIAMRQVLLDNARKAATVKRGGGRHQVTITDVTDELATTIDILDLEAAFQGLESKHPRPARVAELRLFAGLSLDEIALALDVSLRTVGYDWRFARAHLQRALADGAG